MFTGLVESLGRIKNIITIDNNITLTVECQFTNELKIDESVSHNGICLTVESIMDNEYTVTAIQETIDKTTIRYWNEGDYVNLERAMFLNDRLGGHIVQGHVDGVGKLLNIEDQNGSIRYTFEYDPAFAALVIEKGSICVNGTSLTAFNVTNKTFDVAIIPYTFENTIFKYIKLGDMCNIEFDILGKYILRQQSINL